MAEFKLWLRIALRLSIPIVGALLCGFTVMLFIFALIPLMALSAIIWIINEENKFEELSIIVLWPTVLFFYYLDWLKRKKVIKE